MEKPEEEQKEDDGVRQVYRVAYTSRPQIVVQEYVKMGLRWVSKKTKKIKWQGRSKSYVKIIRAQNKEEAIAMLQEAAKEERYSGKRKNHSSYRVLVEITAWEELL